LVTGLRSVKVDEPAIGLYEVFDVAGRCLGQFTELSEIRSIPQKGILIVKRINKESIETFKFVNK